MRAGAIFRIASVLLLLRSLWISGMVRAQFSNDRHFGISFAITMVFALLNAVWFKKMLEKAAKTMASRKFQKSKSA